MNILINILIILLRENWNIMIPKISFRIYIFHLISRGFHIYIYFITYIYIYTQQANTARKINNIYIYIAYWREIVIGNEEILYVEAHLFFYLLVRYIYLNIFVIYLLEIRHTLRICFDYEWANRTNINTNILNTKYIWYVFVVFIEVFNI